MRARLEIEPRKSPRQARAQKTVERILATTADLLDEIGFDRVTTNMVAERAGVNIASLYAYFPNKYSLLHSLALRLAERQVAQIRSYIDRIGPDMPWQIASDGIVDAMLTASRNEPGFAALQHALMAVPELRTVYRQSNDELVDAMERFLKRYGVTLPREQVALIQMSLGETSAILFDLAVSQGGGVDHRVIDELKRLHRGYLGTYIGTGNAR
ncbi:MAG: TetR/AcrR family transcriptional regulator [Dongiaceae bacterium]